MFFLDLDIAIAIPIVIMAIVSTYMIGLLEYNDSVVMSIVMSVTMAVAMMAIVVIVQTY